MIRVLIADDHAMFRQGLINFLGTAADVEIVADCGDGATALRMIGEFVPDVALLDITMPVMDGLSVVKSICAKGLATRAIMLTMHDDALVYHRAVNAGARGYILKDDAYEELLDAVRSVASGGYAISPGMRDAGVDLDPSVPELTHREKQVLDLITHGCTNRMIAQHMGISIKTVNNHRANLMSKLNIHSTAELVRYALQTGG